MFSGLVAYQGHVTSVQHLPGGGVTLRVTCAPAVTEGVEIKDSICVNGVCLTATAVDHDEITFDVIPETLARSTLGSLANGDAVNVELSMRLGDRMGGHFVYGHVDCAATVTGLVREGQGMRMNIELPQALVRYICEKGYVSVDGVSLTIARVAAGQFELALIPETLDRTTLGARRIGDKVNLEIDPIARYAAACVDQQSLAGTSAELEWAFEI